MNSQQYFARTSAILPPEVAGSCRVLIAGCGSGGGRVADELVRTGMAVTLVDLPDERLEEHNLVRHVLDAQYLGMRKIEALVQVLRRRAPFTTVEAYGLDVGRDAERLDALVAEHDLIVAATDTEASKHSLNESALRCGRPAVYAGVFDGGIGGELVRVLPGQACYACVSSYLNRSSRVQEVLPEKNLDYTADPAAFRTTACLNMDIGMIALLHARVALVTVLKVRGLLDGTMPDPFEGGNYYPFFLRPGHGFEPLRLELWQVPRDPACLVCRAPEARDFERDAARILAAARVQRPQVEP